MNFAHLLGVPQLDDLIARVDRKLQIVFASNNDLLRDSSSRVAAAGGKRLRPMLVMAAAASQGGKINDNAIDAAVAIELAHLGTIVHDDLIDTAKIRWGKPTVAEVVGHDQAILVGDYLLALAITHATTVSGDAARLVGETIAEMCAGQSLECSEEYNSDRTQASYYSAIRAKTGALISASCQIGGMCAGLSPADIKALGKYGEAFGMAFQLSDDILDFLSTTEDMGKPVGNDLKEGVYTLPILIAREGNEAQQVRKWLSRETSAHLNLDEVNRVLIQSGAMQKTIEQIQIQNTKAKEALGILKITEVVNGLQNIPEVYLEWAMQKQRLIDYYRH